MVKPKKQLGQHFLVDENIAQQITDGLSGNGYQKVLEIGPGTGVLTKLLLQREELDLHVIEIDRESVAFLEKHYPELGERIIAKNFLKQDLVPLLGDNFAIIGNFPYNISSQILFRTFENRHAIPELVGMFQMEVAKRIAAPPGSKTYGILSVLLQSAYDIEYLFSVPPSVFRPPPKVHSGVIRLVRKTNWEIPIPDHQFKAIVKVAFNQRRKTIRNSIKSLLGGKEGQHELLQKRPEQIGFQDFITLAQWIEEL